MTKKRVSALAKDLNLKGADLVEMLKKVGFGLDRKLSINSSVDEFEVLQIRALLENAHVIPETAEAVESADAKGATGIRRKPRKPGSISDTPGDREAAPESVAEARSAMSTEHRVAEHRVADPHAVATHAPGHGASGHNAPPLHRVDVAPHTAHPHTPLDADTETASTLDETQELTESELDVAVENLDEAGLEVADAEIAEADVMDETTAPAEAEVSEGAEVDTGQPAAPKARIEPPRESAHSEPRPTRSSARPAARIVGHIDPALLKPVRPQTMPGQQGGAAAQGNISVSGSDADVRPTMKHNRSRALTRSDVSQSRDRLSSAQLREKEQSRVRRLTGPQKGGLGAMSTRGGMSSVGSSGRGGSSTHERRSQIVITPPVTMRALSEALGLKLQDLTKTMFMQFKRIVLPNASLTDEDAKLLAYEHGFEIEVHTAATAEEEITAFSAKQESEDPTRMERRAPVIAFLGHVDHGKTSLIDAIRNENVAGGEAGGITQHIGAYRVNTKSGHPITILDTPGHEAFTEMRKRGAQSTDIVVLVVAADDGVMPQTEEAYAHAKAAGVPVIVALNKGDRASEPQKERTVGQLAGLGLAPEMWHDTNWGGHTAVIETSATKRTGIDELLERVWLEADVLDLKADPGREPEGVVIEAQKSGQRGIVATLLVRKGTLRRGDIILAGAGYGRVRNISDDRGQSLDEAGPSIPVEVTGLSELPAAGDHFVVVDDLQQAADAAGERARKLREMERAGAAREAVSLSNLFSRIKEGQAKVVKIVLKADVGGSLEVLKKELTSLSAKDSLGNEIVVKILHSGVGAITEADVSLAAASGGVVVGFHVLASDGVKKLGQREGVEVQVYQILYELVNDVRKALEGLLSPVQREVIAGHAEIRAVFRSSKVGNIAGCIVTDGVIQRSSSIRIIRNGSVLYSGKLESLRRLKDDVREVKAGFECGIKVAGYEDVKEQDVLECFDLKEEKPVLNTST